MIRKKILCLGLLLWVSVAVAGALNVYELADLLIKAYRGNQPIPVLSENYPELDIETAYRVQRVYVLRRLSNDQIAGFKAGLTSEESQKKFGVDFPVAGVLFASGKKTDSPTINRSKFKMPMIEAEIGFLVGKSIIKPFKDVSALHESIQAVMPVIELPDLGFTGLKRRKAVDVVASNVGATQFIVGQEKEFNNLDLNNVTVTLSLDGQVINQGKGADALGDQWKAALWMVNTMVNKGWQIEPGHILITGVLGTMIPGKQGKYMADYGSLGKISFEIQ
jgi:2-keto-4-pentenoate hydratase